MKHQTLGQIAKYAKAELHPAIEESRIVRAVSIDTRTLTREMSTSPSSENG